MSLCRTLEEGAGAMCEGSYTRPKLEAPSADIGQQDALAGRPHGGLRGRAATGRPSTPCAISHSLAFTHLAAEHRMDWVCGRLAGTVMRLRACSFIGILA
jgi:hypothetical protein